MDKNDWKKFVRGNKEIFAQEIEKVKEDSYRVAYCYMHSENDAMDCVCNAIEKAYLNLRRLKEPCFFKTWFIRIVINECKMMLKKKKAVLELSDSLYAENYDIDRSGIMDLKRLLSLLPQEDRSLIYMKYYLGYTLDEIAQIVEKPSGTVRTKIYGALKKLKTGLKIEEA